MLSSNVFFINTGVPVLNQFSGQDGTPLIVNTSTDDLYYSLSGAVHKYAPTAFTASTVKATSAAGYISSDGSTGFTGTVTTASLVGKTITIKDGIITNVA